MRSSNWLWAVGALLVTAIRAAAADPSSPVPDEAKSFGWLFRSEWSLQRWLIMAFALVVGWFVLFDYVFVSMLDPSKPADKCPWPRNAFRRTIVYYWFFALVVFVALFSLYPGQDLRANLDFLPGGQSFSLVRMLRQGWIAALVVGIVLGIILTLLFKPRRPTPAGRTA